MEKKEEKRGHQLRNEIRKGLFGPKPTSGCSLSLLQANLAILPKEYAEDFSRFCSLNKTPCPVLYRSSPGEVSCAPLTSSKFPSDIRTDLPLYRIYRNGKLEKEVEDIKEIWKEKGEEMVCFYLGCSFSFESALISRGIPVRNIQEGKNVSMYNTTIPCKRAGPFDCNLVVSMRPLPSHQVEEAKEITGRFELAHGAPVFSGTPSKIGISDHDWVHPPFGDTVEVKEGETPVFWACGVTSTVAVTTPPEIPLCITHSPGHMFVSDIEESSIEGLPSGLSLLLKGVDGLDEKLQLVMGRLESVVQTDPGQRGIKYFHKGGELHRSCLKIFDADKVALVTGFPCLYTRFDPPTETDGLTGTASLAFTLLSIGKRVTIITDEINQEPVTAAVTAACGELDLFKSCLDWLIISPQTDPKSLNVSEFDHMIAIERAGRASDGKYYTMSGFDMSPIVGPADDLFLAVQELYGEKGERKCYTTGIGDGGNEMGMGSVSQKVREHVKNGEKIACVTPADFVITAGTSDWGAYALSASLAVTAAAVNWPNAQKVFLENDCALAALTASVKSGARDGITRALAPSVDGLEFEPHHSILLDTLRNILHDFLSLKLY